MSRTLLVDTHETCLEDQQETHANERKTKHARKPMDLRIARPTDDEESDGESDRSNHHRRQTHLGLSSTVLGFLQGAAEDGVAVGDVYRCEDRYKIDVNEVERNERTGSDEASYKDGEERESSRDGAPAAIFLVNDGNGAEQHVEDTEAKSEYS